LSDSETLPFDEFGISENMKLETLHFGFSDL